MSSAPVDVGAAHVRRIADDDVERLAAQLLEPARFDEANVERRAASHWRARRQRSALQSVAVTRAARRVVLDGQRDRPAAGADIEHGRLGDGRQRPRARPRRAAPFPARGTSTSGDTASGSEKNSRSPVRYASGSPRARRSTQRSESRRGIGLEHALRRREHGGARAPASRTRATAPHRGAACRCARRAVGGRSQRRRPFAARHPRGRARCARHVSSRGRARRAGPLDTRSRAARSRRRDRR